MRLYPWLLPHFEQLIVGYRTGCGHHALLIQALPGMGCDALVYAITRFLICQQPKGHESCENCRSCQLMQVGTHPDYYAFKLKSGKSMHSIDAVRDLSEKLHEHAHMDGAKVVWLKHAELLTVAASNALLKVVENPPERTWFFLSCYEPKRLLSTLRSRCCLHYLNAPQEELAINWILKKVSLSRGVVVTALRLCKGAPIAALELLENNNWTERAKLCLALGNVLKSCNWLNLLTVLNNEQVVLRLQWLIALLLDALKIQHGATVITNVDAWALVNSLSKTLDGAVLYAIIHNLCHCHEKFLTVNSLNRELILTDQLLTIEYYLQPDAILPVYYF